MQVDRGGYLMFVSSLALGGAAGYVASEKDVVPHLDRRGPASTVTTSADHAVTGTTGAAGAPATTSAPAAPAFTAVADASAAAVGPTCDDAIGEPEACPPIGLPTEEGGCGGFTQKRCNDFKQSMKPRVAAAAVACLNKLNGGERCDPKRVDLCAHLALMNACEERAPAATALAVDRACDGLVSACASSPVAPSKAECRLAMSGLKEVGRDAMVECVKKHCNDRGILGCEAVGPVPPRP